MLRFESDYLEGAHPAILEALVDSNFEQAPGYGTDPHCERARDLIRGLCEAPVAQVHFLVGGTQTNQTVIAALLRPHQGVVSATSGHIYTNESGAIEATGHKVLALPTEDGKITAEQVRKIHADHFDSPIAEHKVQPGMVYISHPSETGTTYSLEELTELSRACRELGLPLFMDGARMAYGLAARPEVSLSQIARLCDVFYIGGTKVGALFGEAVVIPNPALMPDFRYHIKQRGGMLAKGRLLGIQFEVLMADGLYERLGRRAVEQAGRIRAALAEQGFGFRYDSLSNQLFPILPKAARESLGREFSFSLLQRLDDDLAVIRICTSWATTDEAVDRLIAHIKQL